MEKILTAQIREEIYYSQICGGGFPKSRKNAKMEQEEMVIYYTLINESSRKEKRGKKSSHGVNQQHKANDIVPQSWVIDSQKSTRYLKKIIKFFR